MGTLKPAQQRGRARKRLQQLRQLHTVTSVTRRYKDHAMRVHGTCDRFVRNS